MNKSWKLIPKILSGEKSIESRWYQTRRTPWNRASFGDVIFFKNSGEPVTAKATVSEVIQFEFLGDEEIRGVINDYGKEICLVETDFKKWGKIPRYCVLMRLKDPELIKSFEVSKEGFGTGAAWMTVERISDIIKR